MVSAGWIWFFFESYYITFPHIYIYFLYTYISTHTFCIFIHLHIFLYFYTSNSHQLSKSASGLSEWFPEDRVGGVVENTAVQLQHLEVLAGAERWAEVLPVDQFLAGTVRGQTLWYSRGYMQLKTFSEQAEHHSHGPFKWTDTQAWTGSGVTR